MKNVISAVVVFLVMAFASSAMADNKWRFDATITSYHFVDIPDNVSEFNYMNTGIQVERMVSDTDYVVGGYYKNSFYKKCVVLSECDELSYYVGGGRIFYETEHTRWAYETAIVSGYERSTVLVLGDVQLMGGVTLSQEIFENHAIKILFNLPGVIALQYQYGFDR